MCVCVCCRQVCEILQVHSPYSTANGAPAANRHSRPADTDSIVISDSDDEIHAVQSRPPTAKGSVGQGHEEGRVLTGVVSLTPIGLYTHTYISCEV